MAIIKRCVICDEKLIRNRCPLCGLDHTRQMKMQYRLNTSRPYTSYENHTPQRTVSQGNVRKNNSPQNTSHQSIRQRAVQQPNSVQNTTRQTTAKQNTTQQKVSQRMEYTAKTVSTKNVSPRAAVSASSSAFELKQKLAEASYKRAENVKKDMKKSKGWISLLPSVIAIVIALIGVLANLMEGNSTYEPAPEIAYEDEINREVYENVEYVLSYDGEHFEEIFTEGEYIVGVHLPEGYYTIEITNGWGYLDIVNPYQGISDWYSFESGYSNWGINELQDIPLYQGTMLTISDDLQFTTDSGQMQMMNDTENPISSDTVIALETGIYYTVGEDIPAGAYDFKLIQGDAYLKCGLPSENEPNMMTSVYREIWLGMENLTPIYRNLVLTDGMVVYLDPYSTCESVLIPSEIVDCNGYDTYYDLYW